MTFEFDLTGERLSTTVLVDPDGFYTFGAPEARTPRRSFKPGALTRSTCLDLVPWPLVVWDVNGYYHDLGVGFRATRRELMEAYVRGDGPNDERLTYIFAQLLNTDVRRRYDASPLGSRFIDKYLIQELEDKARKVARARGEEVSVEEVFKEWGFFDESSEEEESETSDRVDIPKKVGKDDDHGAGPEEDWPYTFYIWRTLDLSYSEQVMVMRRWQEALAKACHSQRLVANFGVGLMGSRGAPARTMALSVGGVTVLFIAEDELAHITELAAQSLDFLT